MYELIGDNFDLGLPREEFYKSACCAEWCEHEPIPPSTGLVQLDVELGGLHDCDDLNDASRAPAMLTGLVDVAGEASCLQILEPEEGEKHVTAGAVADDESLWCLPAAVTHATPAPAAPTIAGATMITETLPRTKSSRRMTSVLALNDGGVHECDGATSCKSPAPDACSLASRRGPMRPVKIDSQNEKVSRVSASGRKRFQTQKPVRPRSRAVQTKTRTTSTSVKVFKVKPRLRRRNYGNPGEYALGGRCDGEAADSAQPVPIDGKVLAEHFHMPLNRAAQQLGICATALKKVSRRLGVLNWPYQQLKPIQRRLADLRESIQKAKTSAFPDRDEIAKEQKEVDRLEKQQLALLRVPCEAVEARKPAAKKQRIR